MGRRHVVLAAARFRASSPLKSLRFSTMAEPAERTAVPERRGHSRSAGALRRDSAISCEGVWKTFRIPYDRPYTLKQRVLHPRRSFAARELDALRDVSFDVEQGEFLGIIGRNGSGKSTLLKCLARIYVPSSGRISVSGRLSPFIELGVGFNPELTALDNVVVNASLLGISPADARARFEEVVRFAELEDFVHLKLKNYSSGMYVRLGFAAAIQADADIYLVDEVLAVGDARFQEKCFDTFKRLMAEGRTIVFVTHDLGSIERLCDRALLLERGQIAVLGNPHDVVQVYRQHNLEDEQAEIEPGAPPAAPAKRWGDGAAEILEAWFESEAGERQRVFRQGETAVFRARIRFVREMVEPIFGIVVKNERGDHAFVTNSMWDGIGTGTFSPHHEAWYTVRFELHFADGLHTASLAVAYQNGQRWADWYEDAASVVVRAEQYTTGVVDLPHASTVERAEADDTRSASAAVTPIGPQV
jgi:ABC-type polysaccharide/polyol phosphate transport system ATPase subunit